MHVTKTSLVGLVVAESTPHRDDRGSFIRFFCERELNAYIGDRCIVQINHSHTAEVGAVRGMHYQTPPYAEMKLVRCIRGRVMDVAIDLRQGSQTFLQWFAQELTPENALMMVIPEGFAHGYQVMAADSELLYLHSAAYTPEAEGGVRHDDPAIGIVWPLPVKDLSVRDQQHSLIKSDFQGLII